MADQSVILDDLNVVRSDLRELKKCQVHYFVLSVAATAALLGLESATAELVPRQMIFLAPLVVILPCWLIFFDKATTITRNVGYARVLESFIAGPGAKTYLGFECALAEYRKAEDKGEIPGGNPGWRERARILLRTLLLATRHRYWAINWHTFFMLSALCCLLSFQGCTQQFPALICTLVALGLVFLTSIYTLRILASLTSGRFAYDRITKSWEVVFNIAQK